MFTINDGDGRQVAACATLDEADAWLDDVCEQTRAQVEAGGEGVRDMRLRYEVHDEVGRAVMWLSYGPDGDMRSGSLFPDPSDRCFHWRA